MSVQRGGQRLQIHGSLESGFKASFSRNIWLTETSGQVTMSRIAVGDMGLKRIDARSNAKCTDVSRVAAKGLSKVKKGLEVQV